jgi:hypothetical protein
MLPTAGSFLPLLKQPLVRLTTGFIVVAIVVPFLFPQLGNWLLSDYKNGHARVLQ